MQEFSKCKFSVVMRLLTERLSLQVFGQLRPVLGHTSVSLHLVEVSPALSRLQAQNLTSGRSQEADTMDEPVYRRGETVAGLPVSWYRRLEDVPLGTAGRREALVLAVSQEVKHLTASVCLPLRVQHLCGS